MTVQAVKYFNIHTHYQPQQADEGIVRNAFLHGFQKGLPAYALSQGLHPWYSSMYTEQELEEKLLQCIRNNKPLALGECGIDLLRGAPAKHQEALLQVQAGLSKHFSLPMILHVVKGWEQTARVLQHHPCPVVLHGFRNNIQVFEHMQRHTQAYVSIGSAILQDNKAMENLVCKLPLACILAETDTLRIPVRTVYEKIAGLRKEDPELIRVTINDNVKRILPGIQFQ